MILGGRQSWRAALDCKSNSCGMSGFESHPANYKHKQQILTNKRKFKFLFKLKIKEDIFKTQVLKIGLG